MRTEHIQSSASFAGILLPISGDFMRDSGRISRLKSQMAMSRFGRINENQVADGQP